MEICCEKCPLQFGNRTVLNMHMRLVHKTEAKSTNTEKIVSDLQNIVYEKRETVTVHSWLIVNKKILDMWEGRIITQKWIG